MTNREQSIAARPITAAAFAPFGQLLETPGEGARLDRAGALFNGREAATPNLALVRATAARLPLTIELMERHPHSSQAFFPLAGGRYLVMV